MGRRTWIPGILVLALTLAGCGRLGFQSDVSARDVSQTESRAEQNTTEDREQNTQDAEAQAQRDASAEQAGSATPGVADTSKAIIKATFDAPFAPNGKRSEEHTSELQSRENLVCRLLLEKKN